MTAAFRLIAKAVTLQIPPRVLLFGLMNKLNFLFHTGNRRYEFERLYGETFDPWAYHTSDYERDKYQATLTKVLDACQARRVALEVGCSLGVFSGMLADNFDLVVSVDISNEALHLARDHNRERRNLRFVRSEIQRFAEPLQADVITCAEVLYYIRGADGRRVCDALDRCLAPGGRIVYVSGIPAGPSSDYYFHGWPEILAGRFETLQKHLISDVDRPYEIIIFGKRS